MNLYDFSAYVKKREYRQSTERVEELMSHLNEPGAVLELKSEVTTWFSLHREILKIAS